MLSQALYQPHYWQKASNETWNQEETKYFMLPIKYF